MCKAKAVPLAPLLRPLSECFLEGTSVLVKWVSAKTIPEVTCEGPWTVWATSNQLHRSEYQFLHSSMIATLSWMVYCGGASPGHRSISSSGPREASFEDRQWEKRLLKDKVVQLQRKDWKVLFFQEALWETLPQINRHTNKPTQNGSVCQSYINREENKFIQWEKGKKKKKPECWPVSPCA